MKDIIYLDGKNVLEDKEKIEKAVREPSAPVFVFDAPKVKLSEYIDILRDYCGMAGETLSRMRICEELDLRWKVRLSAEGSRQKKPEYPANMRKLLELLDQGTRYRLEVEDDDRDLLANVIRRMVYINYPIEKIDFQLRKEYKGADRDGHSPRKPGRENERH